MGQEELQVEKIKNSVVNLYESYYHVISNYTLLS